MAKSIFVAAAVSLALSGIAHCGELDGKVLICDLVGMNYNKTMFSFEGDQVVETHLLYKNMHDNNYNFDYVIDNNGTLEELVEKIKNLIRTSSFIVK